MTSAMSAAVPVNSVTASAAMAVVVSPSIVFTSAAATDPASTVARKDPLSFTPAEPATAAISAAVPVISVALVIVINPDVSASIAVTSAASSVTLLIVDFTSVASVKPADVKTDFTFAIAPVIVCTAVATTSTFVTPFTMAKSVAAADVSVTVIVRALLPDPLVSVVKVIRSPSEIVAVMIPDVAASMVFSSATVAVLPPSTVAMKSPSMLMFAAPADTTPAISVPVPVKPVTAVASTVPVVALSIANTSAASTDPAESVAAKSSANVIVPAVSAATTSAIFAAVPVIVPTPVAFTATLVTPSRASKLSAVALASVTATEIASVASVVSCNRPPAPAKNPTEAVAVTTPAVFPAMELISATEFVPLTLTV